MAHITDNPHFNRHTICRITVIGYWDLYPHYCRKGIPQRRWQRSSHRNNRTRTLPVWKIAGMMKSAWMKAMRDHLLDDNCPHCQPGWVMQRYAEKTEALERANEDVRTLARQIHAARPTASTKDALRRIEAVHAAFMVRMTARRAA